MYYIEWHPRLLTHANHNPLLLNSPTHLLTHQTQLPLSPTQDANLSGNINPNVVYPKDLSLGTNEKTFSSRAVFHPIPVPFIHTMSAP